MAKEPVSQIRDCYIVPRKGDKTILFDFKEDGRAIVNLDKYAVIPLEMFTDDEMKAASARFHSGVNNVR